MLLTPTPTPNPTSLSQLVLALRRRRESATPRESNRDFAELKELVTPIFRRATGRYLNPRFTLKEIQQECLVCLLDSVNRYTPEIANRVSFEAFLGVCLRKHLSRYYHLSGIRFGGVGLKLARKVSSLNNRAHLDGVDRTDSSAVFDYAISQGANPTIVRRQLPLLVCQAELDRPVDAGDGSSTRRLGDMLALQIEEETEEPATDIHVLLNLIMSLPTTQRRVLERNFGLDGGAPQNLATIARYEGVHACSIAERRDRALASLRKNLPQQAVRQWN